MRLPDVVEALQEELLPLLELPDLVSLACTCKQLKQRVFGTINIFSQKW